MSKLFLLILILIAIYVGVELGVKASEYYIARAKCKHISIKRKSERKPK